MQVQALRLRYADTAQTTLAQIQGQSSRAAKLAGSEAVAQDVRRLLTEAAYATGDSVLELLDLVRARAELGDSPENGKHAADYIMSRWQDLCAQVRKDLG
jgi:hypothetical protein